MTVNALASHGHCSPQNPHVALCNLFPVPLKHTLLLKLAPASTSVAIQEGYSEALLRHRKHLKSLACYCESVFDPISRLNTIIGNRDKLCSDLSNIDVMND